MYNALTNSNLQQCNEIECESGKVGTPTSIASSHPHSNSLYWYIRCALFGGRISEKKSMSYMPANAVYIYINR